MGIQQPYMPIFAGENYDYWCVRMKTLFQSQGLWNLVQNGYDEPDSTTTLTSAQEQQLEETRKNDAKALFFIQQALSDELFPRIIEVKKSKEAWDILQQEFQGDKKVRIISASGATSSLFNSTWQPTKRSFNSTFPSTGFYFGASSVSVVATNSAPMVFGSSTPSGSSDSIFSFASAASTATASSQAQPVFGSAVPVFTAASGNGDQMSMEDSMAEDPVRASIMPAFPVFGQPPISAPSSGFMFGSTAPSPGLAFQFGSLQLNQRASQNPSPFQSSGSLEFGAGGSFPLGSGAATDKRRLKIVKVKRKNRKR
ncbi:nuclear pore complex protein NUP1-like isoform X2 [Camellia sinensis]|uniref:nuclear pore complex protein NUP1-like isoform X1 n=1 Tax=Camellia sinensis TaxID=4442 RepID=UPI001035B918|nr:nuclear pore complex protein NUP1-like isoform X1 [Camellia sinensis]XP_028086911.1 nuclear pore complex protein NUP1-like isoform X2 [Camellia sinensis]